MFGRVQGVSFRQHARDKARQLRLKGWIQNTAGGQSVKGEAVGAKDAIHSL